MNGHESPRRIRFTVLNASQLRTHAARLKLPKCFYVLSTGDSLVDKESKLSQGSSPMWDHESFELDENSVVRLVVFQRCLLRPRTRTLLGEVVLRLGDLVQGQDDSSEQEYNLTKRGSAQQGKYGKVTIRLEPLDAQTATPVSSGLPLETQIIPAADHAALDALTLSNTPSTAHLSTTLSGSDSFSRVCGYVEKLVYVGDVVTKINPWANFAWSILSAIPKSLIAQLDRDQRIQELWAAAADMLDFLKDSAVAVDSIPASVVEAMMKQIYDCALFVREYAGIGFLKRALRDGLGSSCDRIVAQYINSLHVLKEQFTSRSSVATLGICRDVQRGVVGLRDALEQLKEAERTRLLNSLSGTNLGGARCDENHTCLPGTRMSLLSDIAKWVNDPDGARVFWLHGVAGSGKSMVANTITSQFTQLGRMGASFRFNRAIDGRNSPALVIGNIAYQLAHYDPQYKATLLRAVEKHGAMNMYSLREQLRKFIIDPLSAVECSGPTIIVLDALDESGPENVREELLEALVAEVPATPTYVRILLISRSEIDIHAYLASGSHLQSINDVPGTREDIMVYIADELSKIRRRHAHLAPEWPGEQAIAELGHRADGLFIWVTVACDYIRRSLDPDVSLHHLLSVDDLNVHRPRAESKLDQLYLGILHRAMAEYPPLEAAAIFQYVMGSVVAAKTPMARTTLDRLLGLNQGVTKILHNGQHMELTTSESILASLGSIIRRDDGLVRVLHTSIADVLTNDQRCADTRFYVDISNQNHLLASRCLQSMAELRRDICNIKDSTKLNAEVPDLDQRLAECLPEHVKYASQFWYQHLLDANSPNDSLYEDIRGFFSSHLLNWMEVMSLLNSTDTIITALRSIKTWVNHNFHFKGDGTAQLIDEALRFIQLFHEPIQQSAAHIYISALPFTSHETILFRTYAQQLNGIPKCLSNPGSSPYLMTLPHKKGHFVAKIKWGGSLFAYTEDGKTIQLWDAVTCLPVAQLKGHSAPVSAITFSIDGTMIVSGDEWGTIIIWDASSYTANGTPLSLPSQIHARVETLSVSGDKIVAQYGSERFVVWSIDSRATIAEINSEHLLEDRDPHQTLRKADLQLGAGSTFIIHMPKIRGARKVESIIDCLTGENITARFMKGSTMLKCALISPDNKTVVTIDENNITKMLDITTGNINGPPISNPAEAPDPRIKFSGHNGQRLIVINPGSGQIYVYACNSVLMAGPIESGCSSANTNGRLTYVTATALSSDETRLVASTTKKHSNIMIWDVASTQLVATLDYFRAPFPDALSLSPDNSRVVLSSVHGVVLWHLGAEGSDAVAKAKSAESPVTAVVAAPIGRSLLVGLKDGTTILYHNWEAVSSRSVLKNATFPACFSPDGLTVLTANTSKAHTLLRWASSSARSLGRPLGGHMGLIISVVFSADGEKVLSLGKDRRIRTWNARLGTQRLPSICVPGSIQKITLSSNGLWIVAAHDNGDIELLAADTGRTVGQRVMDNSWRYAEFRPSGREICCSTSNGQFRILNWETGGMLADTLSSGGGLVQGLQTPSTRQGDISRYKAFLPTEFWDSVTLSPDGKCVAYMTYASDFVYLAQPSDGTPMCPPLYLPHDTLPKLFFSPDSTRLVALFPGGDVQIWNIHGIPTHEVIPAIHTYPAERIRVVGQRQACSSEGWLRGESGQRLMWLPDNLRDVWVVTAQQRGRRDLVVGREEIVVINMEDFLRTLDGSGGWRAGGLLYMVDESYTALALDQAAAYTTQT